jgi:PIN domain nuclease of toxin-antitoxin system
MALNSFQVLAIDLSHALHIHALPVLHRDPFDRILIAQSRQENMPLLTADPLIAQYSVQTLW